MTTPTNTSDTDTAGLLCRTRGAPTDTCVIQHAYHEHGAHAYHAVYTSLRTRRKTYNVMLPVQANADGHMVIAQGIAATPREAYRAAHRKSRLLRNSFVRIILARWAYWRTVAYAATRTTAEAQRQKLDAWQRVDPSYGEL